MGNLLCFLLYISPYFLLSPQWEHFDAFMFNFDLWYPKLWKLYSKVYLEIKMKCENHYVLIRIDDTQFLAPRLPARILKWVQVMTRQPIRGARAPWLTLSQHSLWLKKHWSWHLPLQRSRSPNKVKLLRVWKYSVLLVNYAPNW